MLGFMLQPNLLDWLIIRPAGLAPSRRSRLTSNVMPHTQHLARASVRFGQQRRHTEDKARSPVATAENSCADDSRPPVVRMSRKPEPRTTMPQMPLSRLARSATSGYEQPMTQTQLCRSSWVTASRISSSYRSNIAGARRASRSEPLGRGAHRSGGVPPLLCHQPGRGEPVRRSITQSQLFHQRAGAA